MRATALLEGAHSQHVARQPILFALLGSLWLHCLCQIGSVAARTAASASRGGVGMKGSRATET